MEDATSDTSSEDEAGAQQGGAVAAEPEWYDAEEDERTELWAQRQRGGRASDALLSCPACLSTVCMDCQRHETLRTQYRAMFARGCRVRKEKVTLLPAEWQSQQGNTAKRKRGKQRPRAEETRGTGAQPPGGGAEAEPSAPQQERFYAVECDACGTEVAKLDEQGVYHFYNVIPSYS